MDDLGSPLGTHHGNLGGRPSIVHIAAQVFGTHHIIGPAIGLAGDHREFGHGRFGIGEQKLGAVLDEAAIFLLGAGQEAGHIDKGDNRNVEGVAETHEPACLA